MIKFYLSSVFFSVKLEATDRDANSSITYSLERGADANITQFFQVQSNGQIKVLKRLDYEQRNQFTLNVRASDGEFFALARVIIKVKDVNDEAPEYILSPNELTVEENMPARTAIGHVSTLYRC